jgi:L-seryl-tRNA(Ser) seleniumtransferase
VATIEKIRKNPYARMFRVCKLTLAALEATLVEFINGTHRKNLPFYRMLDRPVSDLEQTARQIAEQLRGVEGLQAEVAEDVSYIGSGSIPDEGIKTRIVRVRHPRLTAAELARRLRLGTPSVFGRLSDRELVLDMRTLREDEADEIVAALRAAVNRSGRGEGKGGPDGHLG